MRIERLIFEEDNQGAVMSAVVTVEEVKNDAVGQSHPHSRVICACMEGTILDQTHRLKSQEE